MSCRLATDDHPEERLQSYTRISAVVRVRQIGAVRLSPGLRQTRARE
jgi:hypothetical protein